MAVFSEDGIVHKGIIENAESIKSHSNMRERSNEDLSDKKDYKHILQRSKFQLT